MCETDKMTSWKIRLYPVWQEGRENRWLKSMSAKGWHLKKVSFLFYQFEKGEPRDYEYVLDFIIEARTDMDEYRGMIEDTGWRYIDKMGGWQYFRIESDKAKSAEIYTDKDSLNGKYRRVLAVLALCSLPLLTSVLNGGISRSGFGGSFLFYLYGTMLVLILYALVRMVLLVLKKR